MSEQPGRGVGARRRVADGTHRDRGRASDGWDIADGAWGTYARGTLASDVEASA